MGQVNAGNAVSAGNANNGMNTITTKMVGRGSRMTERVSRVCGVSGLRMYWAEERAEPWIAACYKNYRRNTQTALATRWDRLRLRSLGCRGLKKAKNFGGQVGELKGVAKAIGMKSESASRTPAVVREPRPTSILLRITFMSFSAMPAFHSGASPYQL